MTVNFYSSINNALCSNDVYLAMDAVLNHDRKLT